MRGKKAKILRKIAAKMNFKPSGWAVRKFETGSGVETKELVRTGYRAAVKKVKKAYKEKRGYA